MQSPSFGLLSIFNLEPSPTTAGAEPVGTVAPHDFMALLNQLLPSVQTGVQNLPLQGTTAAIEPQSLPLETLSAEQAEALNTLMSQLTMGEISLLLPEAHNGAAGRETLNSSLSGEQLAFLSRQLKQHLQETETETEPTAPFNPAFVPTSPLAPLAQAIQRPAVPSALDESVRQSRPSVSLQTNVPINMAEQALDSRPQENLVNFQPKGGALNGSLPDSLELGASPIRQEALSSTLSAGVELAAEGSANTQLNAASAASNGLSSALASSHLSAALNPASAQALTPEALAHLELAQRLELGRDTQQWGGALAGRIVLMVKEGLHEASIHLDPPELGSLQIKLQMQQQQAAIQVQTAHPQVRELLEAQVQRLRDALAESGVALSEFDVSSQQQHAQQEQPSPQQQQQQAELGDSQGVVMAEEYLEDDSLALEQPKAYSLNLLDTFA